MKTSTAVLIVKLLISLRFFQRPKHVIYSRGLVRRVFQHCPMTFLQLHACQVSCVEAGIVMEQNHVSAYMRALSQPKAVIIIKYEDY